MFMSHPPTASEEGSLRDKAVRLFTYLQELAQLRTPKVCDLSSYESILWFHEVPHEPGCFSVAWGTEREGAEVWLEVKKRKEPPCPAIPAICTDWVDPAALCDSSREPQLRDRIAGPPLPETTGDTPSSQATPDESRPQFLELKDEPDVQEQWLRYLIERWPPWAKEHMCWRAVQTIYGKLFTMYQQQKRLGETYELVLGMGLLTWVPPSGQRVRRHLLVGQANLNFDADRGVLSVEPAAEGVKLSLEVDMVEPNERPPVELQLALEKSIEGTAETPWDCGRVEPILRSWVHSIDPQGSYTDDLEPSAQERTTPQVTFAPALILRRRTGRSLVRSLSTIISQIKGGGEIPFGVRRLCEITEEVCPTEADDREPASPRSARDTDLEVYFPLPANEEQRQIAQRVRSNQGVVVQGPPGTGKSHTIANLICHLLAHGKRVLVTSQTPRALKVLRSMIPRQLSALCVSALGNDARAMQDLEDSVLGITEHYYGWNRLTYERKIAELEKTVYGLRKRRAEIEQLLRELREAETYQHRVAGGVYQGTAQSIAKSVAEGTMAHGWFADALQESTEIPFDTSGFRKLLASYRTLTRERCVALQQPAFARQALPNVEEFLTLVREERNASEARARHEARRTTPSFPLLLSADTTARQVATCALRDLQASVGNILRRPLPWIPRAVKGMLTDQDRPWGELHATSAKYLQGLLIRAQMAQARVVAIPSEIDRQKLRGDADDLLKHLNVGGTLGWWIFRRDVVKRALYLTKEVRVNGRPCDNPATLRTLIEQLDVEMRLDQIWAVWKGIAPRIDGPLPRQVAELEEYQEALGIVLGLLRPLDEAKKAIAGIQGIAQPAWHEESSVDDLLFDLDAATAEEAYTRAKSAIDRYITGIQSIAALPNSHPINTEAMKALEARDAQALGSVLKELETLEADRNLLKERGRLAETLTRVAPKLAAAPADNPYDSAWESRLAIIDATWAWARANAWLREFGDQHSGAELETNLEAVQKSLADKLADLAATKAWLFCLGRLKEEQRQHLMAWTLAVKRIGKGTGKRAEKHRRDAQAHMEACRGAIPAWIMPFYRVAETMIPAPHLFDVVIVDEASQSGPETLLLMYIAKQCIIVGDEQQISPDAVGVDRSAVDLLVARHLGGLPHTDSLDPESSLFSQAVIRFGGRIVLREHFRCMPEIIRFSNDLSYRATPLFPLRQYPPHRLEPIVVHHVASGFREGGPQSAQNVPEAEATVDAIRTCCTDPRYRDKTMGVISLQGEYQARVIERLLRDRLDEKEIEGRQLVCGDAYAFQGDERDVIFLSMVAAPNERIGALVKQSDKRRFNVAASRARDQMWLFHTATLNDLNPDDMRAKLLSHCLNPQLSVGEGPDWGKCESDFERDVGQRIHARGYRVVVQYEPFGPGGKRIDLVVEGLRSRLAVECDGDYWHGPEQYDQDMWRQRQLERCGLVFCRVRGSAFYRDPEKALEPLWARVAEIEIRPSGERSHISRGLTEKPEGETAAPTPPNSGIATGGWVKPPLGRKQDEDLTRGGDSVPAAPSFDQNVLFDAEGSDHEVWGNIDDIPQEMVRNALYVNLPSAGTIEREILLRKAARRLGFSKLGRKIRSRLNRAIGAEVRAGRLGTDWQKVWTNQ